MRHTQNRCQSQDAGPGNLTPGPAYVYTVSMAQNNLNSKIINFQ